MSSPSGVRLSSSRNTFSWFLRIIYLFHPATSWHIPGDFSFARPTYTYDSCRRYTYHRQCLYDFQALTTST